MMATFLVACVKESSDPQKPQQTSKVSVPKLKLSTKLKLNWNDEFPEILHKEIPEEGASRFELPGPSMIFYRVGMKICRGSGGMLGLFKLENGAMQVWNLDSPVTIVGVFDAGKCAHASLSKNGKIYISGSDGLFVIEAEGKLKQLRKEATFLLQTTSSNGLWVNNKSGNGLSLLDGEGKVQETAQMKQPREIVLSDEGEVCFYGKVAPSGLKLLNESFEITNLTQYSIRPFDEILGLTGGSLVHTTTGGIQFQSPSNKSDVVPLIGAGLDDAGKVFISGYDEGKVYLDRQGGEAIWLDIPAEYVNGVRPFYVIAIEGSTIWVKGDSQLLQFTPEGKHLEVLPLTNENLEAELIGRAWRLQQIVGTSGRGGVISCVGPSGIALVGFELD